MPSSKRRPGEVSWQDSARRRRMTRLAALSIWATTLRRQDREIGNVWGGSSASQCAEDEDDGTPKKVPCESIRITYEDCLASFALVLSCFFGVGEGSIVASVSGCFLPALNPCLQKSTVLSLLCWLSSKQAGQEAGQAQVLHPAPDADILYQLPANSSM